MEQLQRLKKFGTVAAIIVVIGFIYFVFIKKEDVPDLQVQEEAAAVPGSVDLLAALQTLNTIKLDGQIFKTNTFKSLQDRTIPREPKSPEGRLNPFAPIGVEATTLQISTQTTTTGASAANSSTQSTQQRTDTNTRVTPTSPVSN